MFSQVRCAHRQVAQGGISCAYFLAAPVLATLFFSCAVFLAAPVFGFAVFAVLDWLHTEALRYTENHRDTRRLPDGVAVLICASRDSVAAANPIQPPAPSNERSSSKAIQLLEND